MRLIAFYAPYTGAGKSLAARWVSRRCNMAQASFAAPLRMVVQALTPPIVQYENKDEIISDLGVSWRQIMVAFGNAGRGLSQNFWVRIMERRFALCPFDYVVDDLRFLNEYDFLRQRGAKIIRIENPGREVVTTATEGRLESERFDAVIVNTKKSLRAYLRDVESTAAKLLGEG